MPNPVIRFVSHPRFLRRADVAGAAVAVIDLLRATSTATAALAHGAAAVVPCAGIPAARRLADRYRAAGNRVILAGERGGLRIPGFDRGNSPREFRARVAGATVVMATTNGTRALAAAAGGAWVGAVCLNNLSAAAAVLRARPEPCCLIVAAGEGRGRSPEDELTAGLLIRALTSGARGRGKRGLDRAAHEVLERVARVKPPELEGRLLAFPHAQELIRLGLAQDIKDCARLDTTRIVGSLDADGALRAYKLARPKIRA